MRRILHFVQCVVVNKEMHDMGEDLGVCVYVMHVYVKIISIAELFFPFGHCHTSGWAMILYVLKNHFVNEKKIYLYIKFNEIKS